MSVSLSSSHSFNLPSLLSLFLFLDTIKCNEIWVYDLPNIITFLKLGLTHYITYALSLRVQDTHQHQKAQVINDKTKASSALVPQLQLWHLHWQVYVQSVGVLHNCRSHYNSCVTAMPVQSSKHITIFMTSAGITLGELLYIITSSTIIGTED